MAIESNLILYISGIEVFSLAIALVLVMLAFRGYRKSGSHSYLLAAVGFGLLGAASLVEGVLYQFLGFTLTEAQAFRSTLTSIGLVVLVYSIYSTRPHEPSAGSAQRDHEKPAARVAVSHAGESGRLEVQGLV